MLQKRLAAQILDCSKKRVILNTSKLEEIKEAITKRDVRGLIKMGYIKRKPEKSISRVRARKIKIQKSKGRRKGVGSRKGKKTARLPRKEIWKDSVRIQRRLIKKLRDSEKISVKEYHNLYGKVKGGFFRSERHVKLYITEKGLVK